MFEFTQSLYSAEVQFNKLQPWRGAPLWRVWFLTDVGFNANGLSDTTPLLPRATPRGILRAWCTVQQHYNFRRVFYSMRVGKGYDPLTTRFPGSQRYQHKLSPFI